MKSRKLIASFLSAALAGTAAAPASLAAPAGAPVTIGVAGAVKGVVRAIPPSGGKTVGRVVQSGKPLFLREHVTTGPGGHLQIMLLDETIFSIGPDSDVVLDEFIYDPKTDNGKVSASVTKGVFRFITGNIGKKNPSSMEVKLPAGTIGVRGTIVAGRVTPGGPSMVVLLGPGAANTAGEKAGAFNLNNAQGSVLVDKPGFGSSIPGAGIPPTPPAMIPPEQLKAVLGDLAPKTMADRAELGKQMMADRLAQRLGGDEKAEGPEGEEGGPRMTEGERKIAEKMMSGEPLTPEEQAQAREGMERAKMPEGERKLAEKLMSGQALTPEDRQKMGMMMAGAELLEQMGPEGMTPEQTRVAENMMAGNLSPEQQQDMMRHMTPEQRALMGEMMPPPDMPPGMEGRFPIEGEMTAMMGNLPPDGIYGDFSAFGEISDFDSTFQFFNFFFDPNIFQCPTCLPPPGGTATTPPTTWDAILANIPSGTATFPGQSGSFFLDTCKGGGCSGATGTWNFSNVTVNFGTKMISGSAAINAAHAGTSTSISDSVSLNTSFSGASGAAVIDRVGSTGFSNYHFEFRDAGGVIAKELQGNVFYNEANAGGAGLATRGGGPPLLSTRP